MAVDSIIARPTNSVRVMVGAASGCCAREVMAEATERPSPSAGPMQPKLVVMPAVAIDTTATMVALSIGSPSYDRSHYAGLGSGWASTAGLGLVTRVAAAM